jgi:hypothetical protein
MDGHRDDVSSGTVFPSTVFPGTLLPDTLFADPPAQLRPFIRDGRITAVPARHTRRRLLLDEVAQAFEPGRRYPEPVVNEILKPIFDDYCALRRYLVDEEFLSRTPGGVYWRAGGTVS